MKQIRAFSVQLANRKLAIQMFAFTLLLLVGLLGCGTENPVEETTDIAEIGPTGAFHGDVKLIEDVTIYMRLLKAGQLLAQLEFKMDGVGSEKMAEFPGSISASTISPSGIASYHIKEAEPGDYTLQISAKGYQAKELNVTVVADQSSSLDRIALMALEEPVSHLRGILTDVATGAPISQINLQLTDKAGKVYETLTTKKGVFTFENLPVEQALTLTIDHAGYEGKEVAVHPIPAAETLELVVELTPLAEPERLDPGQGLSIGSRAPDFELPDGNGKLHALADYVGNKNVVLIFYRGGW